MQLKAQKSSFVPFSKKQRKIMTWWHPLSPVKDAEGIICDGSIRAGKTFPMSMSFVEWAFYNFDEHSFAICGKTIGSIRRNVILWLKPLLKLRGYDVHEKLGDKVLILSKNGKTNYFYLFGGMDESSQDLIQGFTLAGVLFDEVALMPESFVNQATGRCSVEGSKLWFNCNPGSPSHWFKMNWLDKAKEKGFIHIHFMMEDNPSMSEAKRLTYYNRWAKGGVFFKRFILGLWVMAEGAIFDCLTDDNFYTKLPLSAWHLERCTYTTGVDVGTQNAQVYLLGIDDGDTLWIEKEYFYSGRQSEVQKTHSQYGDDYDSFVSGFPVSKAVLDPAAASFKAELRNRGHRVKDADNEVIEGIRWMLSVIGCRKVKINKSNCPNLIRQMYSYVWDTKPTEKGKEQPLKKDDDGPDCLRYLLKEVFTRRRIGDL